YNDELKSFAIFSSFVKKYCAKSQRIPYYS
ncbi:MAG: hypothetical protein ACI8RD_010784, partial [Bacillariaceae sp.]